MSDCADLEAENRMLRDLLRETRDYAGKVESALSPWIATRSYVKLPEGAEDLGRRICAVLGEVYEGLGYTSGYPGFENNTYVECSESAYPTEPVNGVLSEEPL